MLDYSDASKLTILLQCIYSTIHLNRVYRPEVGPGIRISQPFRPVNDNGITHFQNLNKFDLACYPAKEKNGRKNDQIICEMSSNKNKF